MLMKSDTFSDFFWDIVTFNLMVWVLLVEGYHYKPCLFFLSYLCLDSTGAKYVYVRQLYSWNSCLFHSYLTKDPYTFFMQTLAIIKMVTDLKQTQTQQETKSRQLSPTLTEYLQMAKLNWQCPLSPFDISTPSLYACHRVNSLRTVSLVKLW